MDTVTVLTTSDPVRPYVVELRHDGEPDPYWTDTFAVAAHAQTWAVAQADEKDATLVYRDLRVPTNNGTPETSSPTERFQRTYRRICGKCREALPLTEFGSVMHRNRTTGREVFHGYTENCRACQEAARGK